MAYENNEYREKLDSLERKMKNEPTVSKNGKF